MSDKTIKNYIAWRASKELPNGVINLGIGLPTLVTNYITLGLTSLHSENGILGVGPEADKGSEDNDLVDAGKTPVTEMPHTSYFDSSQSFAMMRGGHIDATVIGALQVSQQGDLASWAIPGKEVLGVGGVMDLAVGAKKVIVATTHLTKDNKPKILQECTYPLTAKNIIDKIVTEYGVFEIDNGKLFLVEKVEEISLEELKNITPASYDVIEGLKNVDRTKIIKNIIN